MWRWQADKELEVSFAPAPPPAPRQTVVLTLGDYEAAPQLAGAGSCAPGAPCSTAFLLLHGSRDESVPPSEAEALDSMLASDGCTSHELRVVPGMGHELVGCEATLAYAIGDWLWRRMHQDGAGGADGEGRGPSGFNIFVDDLGQKVREIHASTRVNLPSINNDDDDDESDEDA
jgi:hypothetical protein